MGLGSRLSRYTNLIKNFDNWGAYLAHKVKNNKEDFTFKVRKAFAVTVPKQMLPPFKENFFDEIYLKEFPQQLFDKPKIQVLDVGANVGYFALYMLSRFPNASIYAYEPMPFNFKKLGEYQKQFDQFDIQIYNKAVADKHTTITLNVSNLDGFSTMASIFDKSTKPVKVDVEAITLEEAMSENKLDSIDFLKLDCEGSEYPILYGANEETLSKVSAISIETHQGQTENENHEALKSFLQKAGFQVRDISKGRYGHIWAWR
ncbi:MAG: FkbM family methyltransferase [Bacteroidota bacterium]